MTNPRAISASILVLAILVPAGVGALRIGTVMYDPEGSDVDHEWIQITNDGSETIPLTQWRLVVNDKRHKIRAEGDNATVPPEASAIITDDIVTYRNDNPSYTGIIFESSFALPNTAATISLVDTEGTVVATKSYQAPPKVKKEKVTATKKVKKPAAPTRAPSAQTQIDVSEEGDTAEEYLDNAAPAGAHVAAAAAAHASAPFGWWLVGAISLGLVGAGTVVAARYVRKEEWDIVEIGDDAV